MALPLEISEPDLKRTAAETWSAGIRRKIKADAELNDDENEKTSGKGGFELIRLI
ncbi:hypothetical protein SDJN02_10821 [Cucurbita argyrosperma subsp. argyrosperma]|nr:hypothetical protein SDJN02_10821 [Cucurbita argyrosperma subsp. argyrosperma]